MIKLGLTGGIGMGKTTAAKMFKDAGCAVFDADKSVHILYAKGGAAIPIIGARFPDALKEGAIDRAVLSKHLRADPLEFEVLESFIHPLVQKMRAEAFLKAKKRGKKIIVIDIPLLYETGADKYMDKVVVVSAPYKIQRERVLARSGMSAEKFSLIYARQMADREKRKRADYVIETDKGLDFTRVQVQNIITDLLKD
ncbi:MAG: dephospho-CoA kinase [Robiginitomaculum sp.]